MLFNRLHPASRTTRLAAVAGTALLAIAVTGCQGVTGIQPVTQVRVIDVSPDAPNLDVYQTPPSQPALSALYNIGFGTVSSYVAAAPGSYTHAAYTAGTQQQLATVHGAFAGGGQYTVLAGNIAADLQMTVLKDQAFPAPTGQIALRFLGESTRAGAVDLYLLPPGSPLAGMAPIAAGLGFGSNTGYINVPAGTYSIVAYPAGALPSISSPAFTGSQTAFPATSARTVLLIDEPPQQPTQQTDQTSTAHALQIITADDYDPAS